MRRPRRRGFMLMTVVVVMSLAAGVLAVLAGWSIQHYREVQAERVRQVTRAVSDSAAAYARQHLAEWGRRPPTVPIRLDVGSLAPPGLSATATVEIVTGDGRRVCRIAAHVERGSLAAADMVELLMAEPATSSAPVSSGQ